MSIDLYVYMPAFDASVVPRVLGRLLELGMDCEPHPDWDFEKGNGYCPFRLKCLGEVGPESSRNKDIVSGFECCVIDFDYYKELDRLKNPPKLNFFQKYILQAPQLKPTPGEFLADREIDNVLKGCKKAFEITFRDDNILIWYFSTVLAEVTNGIVYDPQGEVYQEAKSLLPTLADIRDEPIEEWQVFTGWDEA